MLFIVDMHYFNFYFGPVMKFFCYFLTFPLIFLLIKNM